MNATTLLLRAAFVAATVSAFALPAVAASSASSASSEAGSASVGSLSTSIEGSSNSSKGDKKVAAGEYRVAEVAAAANRPEHLRLKLQAVEGSGAEGEFFLYVPRVTVAEHALDAGTRVSARTRPYGVEFALAEPGRAFFLAVEDAWLREMRTTPVTL